MTTHKEQTDVCKLQFKTAEERLDALEKWLDSRISKDTFMVTVSIASTIIATLFWFITWTYQQQLNNDKYMEVRAQERHEEILKILWPVKEDVAVLKSKVK